MPHLQKKKDQNVLIYSNALFKRYAALLNHYSTNSIATHIAQRNTKLVTSQPLTRVSSRDYSTERYS